MNKDIELMNRWLERDYGYFEATYPLFRISWSEDQFEKRMVDYSPEGLLLAKPIIQERPKYRQWLHNKYILERIIPVPPIADLVDKTSYEPIWVFENKDGDSLPPNYIVCKIVIASLHAATAKAVGAKYLDPRTRPEFKAEEAMRLQQLQEELFGNETPVTDALAYGTGVVVPSNQEQEPS